MANEGAAAAAGSPDAAAAAAAAAAAGKAGGAGAGDGKAGGAAGAGGTGENKAAVEARTFLADFVDPASIKDVKDDEVLKLKEKVDAAIVKHAKAQKGTPPDKYALKPAEGGWVDQADVKMVESIAREQGWSQEEAQARLDAHGEALAKQSEQFLAATKADPEYGGDKLAESQRFATALLDKVRPKGTPRGDAMRKILDKTGYGNHIEILSLLADLGRLAVEDKVGNLSSGGKGSRTREEIMYDKTPAA